MTPPPRNRDIRDFVASVDLTGDTATASNPRKSTDRRPASVVATTEDEDENGTNNYGAISGRGFVPASELAALEARVGSITKPMAPPPPKRLKTGNRVLRQISGNALPAAEEEPESDREYRPETTTTTSTRRKSLAKLQRTKSSRLPLERTPVGKGTHNLETKLCTTPADIAKLGSGIDLDYSLLRWNEPAIEAYDVFAEVQSQEDDLKVISDKLGELLINKVSDGEMVQDLGELVKTALSTHMEAMAAEMEEVSPSQEMLDDAE
jgi:hypothetical protein